MNTTELDDVIALLERVLPDPTGFAERLFQQVVARWAAAADSGASPIDACDTADWFDPSTVFVTPSPKTGSSERLADSNTLLASALGACDCWGARADCAVCKGAGSSGWTHPDVELFQEFVGPAVEKLSASADSGADNGISAEEQDHVDPRTQGDNA